MINAQKLKEVADLVKGQVEGKGFALVVFDTDDAAREYRYISNCDRADLISTFEAMLTKWKNQKDENN